MAATSAASEVDAPQERARPRTSARHKARKRALDIFLGSIALIALSPVLVLAAIAIKLTSRGPIIFAQERYGRNKRLFKMYKLRTMVLDAEAQQPSLESRNEVTGLAMPVSIR